MQHSQVSFSEFLPSHQDATEVIHPAMGTLHHPAPSLETGFVPDGLCFLAPCPDMGGKAELFHDLSYLIKVISLVQTKPLWGLCRWLRPVSKNRLQRPPHQFHVCRLAPSMAMPIGMPAASVNRLRLTPCLPRSVGFAPVFLNRPPEPWSLHHPLTTKTSQRPGSRRTASSLRARTSRTRLPLPIPGTVDTPKHRSIFRWHCIPERDAILAELSFSQDGTGEFSPWGLYSPCLSGDSHPAVARHFIWRANRICANLLARIDDMCQKSYSAP